MKLKATAVKDVAFWANVVSYENVQLGKAIAQKPVNRMTKIWLPEGQSRDDLSMILGIEPSFLPGHPTATVGTNLALVLCEFNQGSQPETFHGLLRLEWVNT